MDNNIAKVLWILGWIFIFPIPASILLCKVKELPKGVVCILSVVAWIIWGVLVFCVFLSVDYFGLIRAICFINTVVGSVVSVILINKKLATNISPEQSNHEE